MVKLSTQKVFQLCLVNTLMVNTPGINHIGRNYLSSEDKSIFFSELVVIVMAPGRLKRVT